MKRFLRSLTIGLYCTAVASAQSDNAARQKLIASLDALANAQLAERAKAVGRIQTRAEAENRKGLVRRQVLDLIGGLPAHPSSVAAKQFGTLSGEGFRLEKLAYESLPGFWVTANLYVPAVGSGPFPAVLLAPGHEATGKQSQYSWGVNFARNGMVALAIDPLGQGERLQYFDPERKVSIIGGSTGEHGEANVPAMLVGEDIARYFINDSMRGIDYLASRKEVDANRIGAFGCSGGGTSTAYLAALDNRLKAVGVACYVTSFQELLPSATGVQEAEQSIPHFIDRGLDFGDWVEAFAPKPYAIISTTNDMFPFEGARQTYEESKRIYGIYDAADNLQWITGPGGHGNLGPISPAILGFFLHHLKGAPAGDAAFTPERPAQVSDLLVTPTGQVSTSIGGETIASMVRAHAPDLPLKPASLQDIRALTGATAVPGAKGQGSGRKPAILMLDSPEHAAAELDRMAKAGWVAVALQPTPSPPGGEGLKSPYLGSFNLLSLRAFLTGKTIIGLQIDDAVRAVDALAARADVDASRITIYGNGPLGMVALHAAALDARIRSVVVENTLASYRMVLEQPLHRGISEVMIPGVLRKYDVGNLVLAIAPRPVTIINPQDAAGAVISEYVFESKGQSVRVLARGAGEPLPVE